MARTGSMPVFFRHPDPVDRMPVLVYIINVFFFILFSSEGVVPGI